jgi:hypothetical protein
MQIISLDFFWSALDALGFTLAVTMIVLNAPSVRAGTLAMIVKMQL